MISYWQLRWWLNEAVQVSRGTFLETGNLRSASWHFRPRSCVNTEVVAQRVPSPLSICFSHFLEKLLFSERLSQNVRGPCSVNSAQLPHFKTQILVPNRWQCWLPTTPAALFPQPLPTTPAALSFQQALAAGSGLPHFPPPPQGKKHPASWCGYRKTGSIVFTWDSLGGCFTCRASSLWDWLKLLLQISKHPQLSHPCYSIFSQSLSEECCLAYSVWPWTRHPIPGGHWSGSPKQRPEGQG